MSSADPCSALLANPSNNADRDLLEVWRKRLANFRINPDRLEYLDNGKIIASGGFGHVRRAILKPLPQGDITGSEVRVAVKMLHMPVAVDFDAERLEMRFIRETYIWSQVRNENLLEFLGSNFASSDGNVEALLVCPWRLQLSNLLVKSDGRGALCDFGLAQVLEEEFEQIASKSIQRGTLRWTSPERLNDSPPAPPMDVWSWGWLIMTEKIPFHQITNASAVMFHIVTSKLPSCEHEESVGQFPALSRLIQLCWQAEPDSRPLMNKCVADLQQIVEPSKEEETLDDILEHDSYPRKKPRLRGPEATATGDTAPMTLFTSQSMAVPVAKKTIVEAPVESENHGAFATGLGLDLFPWPAQPPVLEKTIAILAESGSIPPGNLSPHGGFSRDRSTPFTSSERAALPETNKRITGASGELGDARTFALESRVLPLPQPPSVEENIASYSPWRPDDSFPPKTSWTYGDISHPSGRTDLAYLTTSEQGVHQAGSNTFPKPEIQVSSYNENLKLAPIRSPHGLTESISFHSLPGSFGQTAEGGNEFRATSVLPWTTESTRGIPVQAERLYPLSLQSLGIGNGPLTSVPGGADGRSQLAITQLTHILENLKQIQSSESQQGATRGPTDVYWNEVTQWISNVPLLGGPRIHARAYRYARKRSRSLVQEGTLKARQLRRRRSEENPPEANLPMIVKGSSEITERVETGSVAFQLPSLTQTQAENPIREEGDDPWVVPSSSHLIRPHNAPGIDVAPVEYPTKGWDGKFIIQSPHPCGCTAAPQPTYVKIELHSEPPGLPQTVKEGYGEPHSRYQEGDIRIYDVSSSGISGSVRQRFVLKTGELVALKSIPCSGKDASIMFSELCQLRAIRPSLVNGIQEETLRIV
ncbi:hypothetical protein FRC04_012229 [Tulasnella sp. 424]|nr:hypothetical protein FRC04_012229 [Tulasnella sp. 424]